MRVSLVLHKARMRPNIGGESKEGGEEAINARVPKDVAEMLRKAKEATGRSQKYLLVDAIRSKYSRYLLGTKAAA